ncbi:MAG TPA: TlpA disulfide reductase family protein [Balneolales bacterium]|nr:TlpA disulfide reductase family protein [Balneolales bacterium]
MSLRIDQKYFNRFAIIVGVIAITLLAASSIYLHISSKDKFYKRAKREQGQINQSYLKDVFSNDSLRVADYQHKYVVLVFWATYASPSKPLFKELDNYRKKYPDKITIIAASVRDSRPTIKKYLAKNVHYSFHYVFGNDLFYHLEIPGLPTFIVFNPDGKLLYSHAGYRNSSALKKLKAVLEQ